MLNELKKHSVKIFVFAINILLAAIAVFVIREKDQTRLLENAQKKNIPSENLNDDILPSFENSVSVENIGSDSSPAAVPAPTDNSGIAAPVPVPAPAVTAPPNPTSNIATPTPAAKSSNAKTKTS